MSMINKILTFINIIFKSVIYYYKTNSNLVSQQEISIRKFVTEVEKILFKMDHFKKEEITSFIETFKYIVEGHKIGRNHVTVWPLQSNHALDEDFGILTTVTDSSFEDKSYILKKLFLNDLLFYYYDFCYRMNEKFSEMNNICEKNLKQIGKLLTEVRKVKEVEIVELGLDSLVKFESETFNIHTFSKILEIIVCIVFNIKRNEIHQYIHNYCNFNLYSYDSEEYIPYKEIHHFIKSYNPLIKEDENTCLLCGDSNSIFRKNLPLTFRGKYINCLTLDITGEYNKRSKSLTDTRFKTYKASEKIVKPCRACNTYCEDMLRSLPCPSHQNILKEIQTEYFEFMDCSWILDSILIRESIRKKIQILVRSKKQELIDFE